MKNSMLSPAISIVILLIATSVCAQDYDLIVTKKGDSIACRIDSITESFLYFEMKNLNQWAQTNIEIEKVSDYQRNSIDKKQYVFKEGTSTIESLKPAQPTSLRDIQRNSIYVGILSASYSRVIPGENVGLNLAAGLNFVPAVFGDVVMFMGEISLLTVGPKHFFEPGFLIATNFDTTLPMVRFGYRYQRPEGFLLRAGFLLGYDDGLSGGPALSFGFSF